MNTYNKCKYGKLYDEMIEQLKAEKVKFLELFDDTRSAEYIICFDISGFTIDTKTSRFVGYSAGNREDR
jgi:hypothetical protein